MHLVLYVCLRRSEARNSLQARKKVCEYLNEQGFAYDLRFAGKCDYFSVGGRFSGVLNLLRLRSENPRLFSRFWKRYYDEGIETDAEGIRVFQEMYPKYPGEVPVCRNQHNYYGRPDDAQIMDDSLFRQLKRGFSEEVLYTWEIDKPNVIFKDLVDDDFRWPKNAEEAAKFWVVIIDYHT